MYIYIEREREKYVYAIKVAPLDSSRFWLQTVGQRLIAFLYHLGSGGCEAANHSTPTNTNQIHVTEQGFSKNLLIVEQAISEVLLASNIDHLSIALFRM